MQFKRKYDNEKQVFVLFLSFCDKMPRGTYLSSIEQGKILALKDEGHTIQTIAKKINRSFHGIKSFLVDTQNYGKSKRGGPKKKLTKREEEVILRKASNSSLTSNQLRAFVDNKVSKTTIKRLISNSEHLVHQKLKPAPRLTATHRSRRLAFGRNNMSTDWSKVRFLFITKTTFSNHLLAYR